MKIFSQPEKFIARHPFAESEHGRTLSDPLPRDLLSLAIVITDAEMLLKILFGILEVVLSFRREHRVDPQFIDERFCNRLPFGSLLSSEVRFHGRHESSFSKSGRPTPSRALGRFVTAMSHASIRHHATTHRQRLTRCNRAVTIRNHVASPHVSKARDEENSVVTALSQPCCNGVTTMARGVVQTCNPPRCGAVT